ncbi:MAG TPA: hypothetical protein VGN93_26560 [Shinella sp.]|nr:hypothetical protein [Shinella sp.]
MDRQRPGHGEDPFTIAAIGDLKIQLHAAGTRATLAKVVAKA